jgi:hypothetical protein
MSTSASQRTGSSESSAAAATALLVQLGQNKIKLLLGWQSVLATRTVIH